MTRRRVQLAPATTGLAGLIGALLVGALVAAPSPAAAQHASGHPAADGAAIPLQQPGNAAFAAVREVVEALNARDDVDWSRVDLEALRQHLVEMERFTLEAEVVEREEIDGGLRVGVRGPDAEVHRSLARSLGAHAPVLARETGWNVSATEEADRIVLEATADTDEEAERIRGLGYIGLMATGAHHTEHHWQIATGQRPHHHDHRGQSPGPDAP